MTAKIRAFTEADYEEIGRRHGSPDVAEKARLYLNLIREKGWIKE